MLCTLVAGGMILESHCGAGHIVTSGRLCPLFQILRNQAEESFRPVLRLAKVVMQHVLYVLCAVHFARFPYPCLSLALSLILGIPSAIFLLSLLQGHPRAVVTRSLRTRKKEAEKGADWLSESNTRAREGRCEIIAPASSPLPPHKSEIAAMHRVRFQRRSADGDGKSVQSIGEGKATPWRQAFSRGSSSGRRSNSNSKLSRSFPHEAAVKSEYLIFAQRLVLSRRMISLAFPAFQLVAVFRRESLSPPAGVQGGDGQDQEALLRL